MHWPRDQEAHLLPDGRASYQRGFPQYVRAFNQAYLALPAVPSEVVMPRPS